MSELVKNRKLKNSSRTWIYRQINDPYVSKSKKDGYRSRAAYKLLEIQDKYKILRKNSIVIDLGAAPGGWSQIASKISTNVIAVDLLQIDPINNVEFICGDFLKDDTIENINFKLCGKKASLILSDMAPNTCGIQKVDHLRIINLVENVLEFCLNNLDDDGTFVTKVFLGGATNEILNKIKKNFKKVSHFKPKSSRKESSEVYLIAQGFYLTAT